MKHEDLIRTAGSLELALEKIKENKAMDYQWFSVKNKKGIYIEVGGRNYDNKLEVKAYIPEFNENKYVVHENGYTKSAYSLNNQGLMEFPTFRLDHKMNYEELIKHLNNTDFSKYFPKIETEEYVESYVTRYYLLKD